MAVAVLVVASFFVGAEFGKQDQARALEGCELVASAVSDELTDTRWRYTDCQHLLIDALDKNQALLKLFLPDYMEGNDVKTER